MAHVVRPYRDDDAEALAGILVAAITRIGPAAYSAEQVAAWSARHPGAAQYRQRAAAGNVIFVADGHVDHLYIHPDHTRCGLATQLLAAAETHARREEFSRLYTEASDLARPVFARAGYAATKKREFAIAHEGRDIPIHNWAMEKTLR